MSGSPRCLMPLQKNLVPAENYPFCTIDPSVGVVAVPDLRVGLLSQFSNSAKLCLPRLSLWILPDL